MQVNNISPVNTNTGVKPVIQQPVIEQPVKACKCDGCNCANKQSVSAEVKFDNTNSAFKITLPKKDSLDSGSWYTLDKEGKATCQNCWNSGNVERQSDDLKELYNELLTKTQNGTQQLNPDDVKEVKEELDEAFNQKS